MALVSQITANFPRSRFVPDKSRGQNFLIDKNVLSKIVAAAELKPSDTVIEIGAGTGILTVELAKRAGRVMAFEIDKRLILCLRDNVRAFKNVEIVEEDILQRHCERPRRGGGAKQSRPIDHGTASLRSQYRIAIEAIPSHYKVVANIPYNITSAVLEKFLSAENKPTLMVLLVQKEVAERVCAKPGEMSLLSVMVQYYGRPEIVARVPASAFWPRPKVESTVLKIKLNIPLLGKEGLGEVDSSTPPRLPFPRGGKEEKYFFQIVKAGFSRRRKMLKNTLKSLNIKFVKNKPLNHLTIKQSQSESRRLDETNIVEILKSIGLSPTVRPQELKVDDWVKLTKSLKNLTTISQRE